MLLSSSEMSKFQLQGGHSRNWVYLHLQLVGFPEAQLIIVGKMDTRLDKHLT